MQGYNVRKNSEMEPMSKFVDPAGQSHLYRVSLLAAGEAGEAGQGRRATPQQQQQQRVFSRSESVFTSGNSLPSQTMSTIRYK